MRLGIVSIQRNRGRFLSEWVSFHYLVGFRKFYIFLHRCTDNTIEVLNLLKEKYDIVYMEVEYNLPLAQLQVYRYAYQTYNHENDWLAFIDGDEFLFSPGRFDIRDALTPHFYQKTSALCPYWVCFGSSGHINEPDGLVIENFKFRGEIDQKQNRHVKSIVKGRQGNLVDVSQNPHLFMTPLGSYDEKGRLLVSAQPDWNPTHDTIRINHYITQSREFFEKNKMKTGTPMDDTGEIFLRLEDWWLCNDLNNHYDTAMDIYIPEVKKLMGLSGSN